MDVKWIKITTDIFDDEKILLIESLPESYAIIVVWFKLLCLAGKQNNSGVFMMNDRIAYTDKMLATIFRMKESTVKMALETFEQFGMIELVGGVITIPNWGKHQSLDQLESRKKYMQNYMQGYRKKQEKKTCKTNRKVNSKVNGKVYGKVNGKVNVNKAELEEELELDKDKEIISFKPPSATEIEKYIREKNYSHVDADTFFSYYESNGWKVGNVDMNNWQASVDVWEIRDKKKAAGQKNNQFNNFEQRKRTEKESAALEKKLLGVM